jgi:hypothetical protein
MELNPASPVLQTCRIRAKQTEFRPSAVYSLEGVEKPFPIYVADMKCPLSERKKILRFTFRMTTNSLMRLKHHREPDDLLTSPELDDAIPSLLPDPGVNYKRAEIREQVNAALANFLQNIAQWSC